MPNTLSPARSAELIEARRKKKTQFEEGESRKRIRRAGKMYYATPVEQPKTLEEYLATLTQIDEKGLM